MPRAGLSKEDLVSRLDEALGDIGVFVKKTAVGDLTSAFTKPTRNGLFIGVGDSQFVFLPNNDNVVDGIPTPQGLLSFEELKALPLPTPQAVHGFDIYSRSPCLIAAGTI